MGSSWTGFEHRDFDDIPRELANPTLVGIPVDDVRPSAHLLPAHPAAGCPAHHRIETPARGGRAAIDVHRVAPGSEVYENGCHEFASPVPLV